MDVPEGGRYDDVFFYNNTLGWACSGYGQIYKTTDGINWGLYFDSQDEYFRCIEFATPQLGFAGSLSGRFYKTLDGGGSWTRIDQTIQSNMPGICGLSAPSANVIYGCGIWSSPGFVVKSVDGGMNWTFTDMSAYASKLVDIYFIDEMHGYVSGRAINESEGGILLYTADGGATWEVKIKTLVNYDYIWKIQSPDNEHFWGSIEGLPMTGNVRVVKSTDSGQNWIQDTIWNNYMRQQMIGFLDENHGFSGSDEFLLETTDGGENWTLNNFDASFFNRFFRISDSLAYIGGSKVYRYSLYGDLGIDQKEFHADEIHKLTVSPNPATYEINISLELKSETHCQIDLFQADGKLVQNIISERSLKGARSWNIDISKVEAKQLFLVMRTNEGMIHRVIVRE